MRALYTAIVKSEDGSSGLALFEIYDLAPSSGSNLANISTRAVTTPGDNTLIAGFILEGNGTDSVVIRGLGPSLPKHLPGRLMDPVLQLRDSNGSLIATNNDWQNNKAQMNEIIAAGLEPSNSREAAIAAVLAPGRYTALLNGSRMRRRVWASLKSMIEERLPPTV